MAKTYYKYKDRGQQVDYAGISKDFSQGIMDTVTGIKKEADEFSDEVKDAQKEVKKDVEERFKEKRKAAGKSVTGEGDYKIELGEYDVPMGGERDANTVFVGLSTTASDRALEFKREYDSQKISANEYLQKKNALDRTFRVMKESAVGMNKLAEETATGLKDGTIDPTQQLAFQELMSYNFTDPRVKIEIGDDGAGYMYRVDDKGKELPRSRKTINEYRNMALQRYDSYDFDGNATEIVTKLGKTLETLGRRGMTTEELLKREPIMNSVNGGVITPMDVIDDYANGLEDDDLASILMGQLGSKFKPTFNPEESVIEDASGNFTDDQSKILFVKRDLASGVNKKTAQLTDEQRERAREFVKRDILTQFNVNPAATTSSRDTEADKKRQSAADAALEETTRLWNLFTGDEAKKAEVMDVYRPSIEALLGKGNYGGYDITDNEIILYQRTKDGLEPRVIDIPSDFKSFVDLASTNFGLSKNLDEMYNKSTSGIEGFDPAAQYKKANVEKRPSIIYKPTKTIEDAVDDLEGALDQITSSYGYYSSDEITAGKIGVDAARGAKSYLTNIGLTKAIVEKGDGNSVKITLDGVTPKSGVIVKLTETKKGAKSDLGTALKAIHDAAGMGQLVTGYPTAEDDDPKPNPANPAGVKKTLVQLKAENPNMTLAELNKLLNNQ